MKSATDFCKELQRDGRSREGAWIEISFITINNVRYAVAPVRERGLKLLYIYVVRGDVTCRSREGAWIEIDSNNVVRVKLGVAPVRERGLKCMVKIGNILTHAVAPVRERGLKSKYIGQYKRKCQKSLP